MGVALEKSSWPSVLRFKRVPFCPFDCRRDIYQQHFWVLIFFFVTDRLVKAWDQCLCHQAAHIHTGDPDWWFSLVGDQNTEWFKFFFKVKFAVMVCFLSSHISVIILVRISTLSPYSKLIKSQDSFISRLIYLIFTCLQLDPWLTQIQTCRSSLCSSAMYLSSWSGHVWSENQGIYKSKPDICQMFNVFRKAKAKYENHDYQDENDNTAERPDSPSWTLHVHRTNYICTIQK